MRKNAKAIAAIFLVSFVLTCLFGVGSVFGTESEYDIAAKNFLKYLNSDKEIVSTQWIKGNSLDATLSEMNIAYLANLSDRGYILISASRRLTPVKAYSLNADFATLPQGYKKFLLLEAEYNIRTLNTRIRSMQPGALSETGRRWDFLLDFDKMRALRTYIPDTFLLTTKWDQGHPYNAFLPEIDGKKALSGCVNVAMAQVLKYHGYPLSGKGVVSYEWSDQQLKAVLYRSYSWGNMPNVLSSTTPKYQTDEVALLISDLGIMNETDFSLDNSSASPNTGALVEHLGFSNSIATMANTDETLFFTTLRTEIDAERPVLLSFPEHMTVADGYSSDQTGRKIHVNMGWGGHDDEYYYLDETVITDNYEFPTDPGQLIIYYNIAPCSGDSCFVNLEAQDSIDGLDITGKFDSEKDVDKYDIYLSGETKVEGTRGYDGQFFYISIYDSGRTLVVSSKNTIEQNLTAGKYTIRISLTSESSGYYSYEENYSAYTVTVSTDDLTTEEKAAINASLDVSPVIYNDAKDILLNSADKESYLVRIDARDENGDSLNLSVTNTNGGAVQADLTGNILTLTPDTGATGLASKITVVAAANGKTVDKPFVVMVSDADIGFGKAFEVSGIFESQEDFNTHKVILDGACSITAYNGYSNQTLYSSVMDTGENTIIQAGNVDINNSFTRGPYLLGASLKQNPEGSGAFYSYEEGVNDRYRLSVSYPDADDSTNTIAALLGIDLSGTETSLPSQGNVNADGTVNLIDLILSMQLISGLNPSQVIYKTGDANGDNRIGLEEVVYIMQRVSGLR